MKKLIDMTLTESTDYWSGRLIIAIGAGKFRDEVITMISVITREATDFGKELAKKARKGK